MAWNIDSISAERRGILLKRFPDAATHVIDHMVELEAALYPFAYTLGCLDGGFRRGTTASSMLFPFETEGGLGLYYDKEKGSVAERELPPLSEMYREPGQWSLADSPTIMPGERLDDSLEVMAVHGHEFAASVGCGSIEMRDVRRAHALLFGAKQRDGDAQ